MRRRLAWLLGAIGLAGLIAWFRRRAEPEAAAPPPDAQAEELRRTLEETRAAAGQPGPEPSPAPAEEPGELETRRQGVHERGRSALEEMGPSPD